MVQISDLLAQISGEPSPTGISLPVNLPPPKRKADSEIRRTSDKIQKTGPSTTANSSRPIHPSSKTATPTISRTTAAMKQIQNGRAQTGGSANSSKTTSTAILKNGQPTPPPNEVNKAPPKKGSYAEIMARGKAAQSAMSQVGKIQHKPIEKVPSKREREEQKNVRAKNLQKNLAPNSKFQRGTNSGQTPLRDGHNGTRENKVKKESPVPEKKIKKAAVATTGYQGTARPKPGALISKHPSSSRPSTTTSSSRYDRGPDRRNPPSSSKRYTYADEDEDEDMEEEDYYSDASSDMEAAVFEVDDEEEKAARIARKEDAEALAEENRLKREKEEKKRKLMAMAASKRKR